MDQVEQEIIFDKDMLEFEQPAPYVDNGTEPIDTKRYYTTEFMDKEWESFWTRIWNVAGRASDIPEVGDYVTFDLRHESFIIVRTGEGEGDIRAFYNVCIHRGNRLAYADMGHASEGFACAYHGWVYGIDGSLKEITMRDRFRDDVVSHLKGLREVNCDLWGGFVFINMDDNAGPLLDFLGEIPKQLEGYQVDRMVTVKDAIAEWPINWKTAIDNFNESYHVHWVHPELPGQFDDTHQFSLYENGHCRTIARYRSLTDIKNTDEVPDLMWHTLYYLGLSPETFQGNAGEARKKIYDIRTARAEKLGLDPRKISDSHLYYLLWPNIILSMHPETILVLQALPNKTDPEKCYLKLTNIAHRVKDPDYDLPEYLGVPIGTDLSGDVRPERQHLDFIDERLGPVLIQDTTIMPYVQEGMKSRGLSGLIYGEMEQRIRHLHTELDRYINGEK